MTHKHINEMGETGAGVTREDQINTDIKTALITKWGTYCDIFC
jgi:hypothetical protein